MPIFGTRPEAIKMAPLVKALENQDEIHTITTVTAQHREMLDQVLNLFNIKPTYDLNIMAPEQTLTQITVKVLQRIESIIKKEKPDLILVHGDTSTTFVSSLAAFYHQIPVGHVEAGLRTYNKYSPYPEEMNRKLTGCLADLHFAPTQTAKDALLKEGIKQESIVVTGNTVIDALLQTVNKDYVFKDETLKKLDFHNKKIILVTAHRRENLGERMQNIFLAIKEIVENNPDIEVVLPVHLNPVVQQAAQEVLGEVERVRLISPLEYEEFVNLMDRCYLVLTDSGGLQEEAPTLGKPVLVAAGTVKLVGTDRGRIVKETTTLITKQTEYQKMAEAINPYGDGKAAERILQAILYNYGLTKQPVKEYRSDMG